MSSRLGNQTFAFLYVPISLFGKTMKGNDQRGERNAQVVTVTEWKAEEERRPLRRACCSRRSLNLSVATTRQRM